MKPLVWRYEDEDAGLPCWFAAKYCEREYMAQTPTISTWANEAEESV
jgi:hypothetical protein